MLEERKEPKFDFEGVPEQPSSEVLGEKELEIVSEKEGENSTLDSTGVSKEQDVSLLNKPVEKVKEGDVSSIASQKVVYGAAKSALLAKQAEEMALKTENNLSIDDKKSVTEKDLSAKEIAMKRQAQRDSSPENLAAYEMVYDSWKESRDRAHKLEAEYNDKYQKHIESQSALLRGVRRTFGFQPKLSGELEALQKASLTARREYHSAAKSLLNVRRGSIKPRIKTSAITQSPKEYGGPEAVEERYQQMLAHHLISGTYKKRLEIQGATINKVWNESSVGRSLGALQRNKYKTMSGIALGATVLSGGAFPVVVAGMAAGLGVGIGTYKILDKTWIASGRKKLASATSNLGSDFFEKSFLDEDGEMEYLTNDVDSRTNLSKTASKIAGASAGMTAAGFVGGLGAESTIPDVTNTPTDAVSPTGPLQQMGDAGVAEKMYPDVKESFNQDAVTTPSEATTEAPSQADVNPPSGGEAVPKGNGEGLPEEHIGPDHEPVEDGDYGHEPNEEDLFDEPAVTHTIEPGGNGWNTMKDHSSVLKDLPLAEQNKWQVKLWDSLTPQEAMDAGFVKSGGNVDLVHPGETINVSMLDQRLTELMQQESGNIPTPTPRPEDVVSGESSLEGGPVKDVATFADLNKLRVGDVLELQQKVMQGDAGAISKMDSLNLDKGSLQDFVNTIMEKGSGDVNGNLTVEEYFESTPDVSNDIIDQTVDPRGEIDSLNDNSNTVREAGLTPETKSITVKSPLGEDVVINRVTDVNQMNLNEAGYLYNAANASDPGALKLIEEMGMDRESYMEMYKSLGVRGQYNADMTVSDWLQASRQGESGLIEGRGTAPEVPPTTPFGGPIPQPGDMPVREASLTPEAVNDNVQQAVQSYVSGVENGGILSSLFGDSIAGTFEKIADLNFGQIKEMAASGNMRSIVDQLGVTETGYEKWMNKLQTEVANNPALSDSETLRQYLARINTPQVAA